MNETAHHERKERTMATETKAQHTQGSWTADGGRVYGTDGYALAETDGVHLHRDFDADKGHWNYEDGSARDISEAEEEANARLIAAAPALLEVLKACAEAIERAHGMRHLEHPTAAEAAALKQAHAAIALATEEPS